MSKTKKVQKTLEPSGRQDALQRVIAQIEKQYGQGAIMQMDEQHYARIEGIPTGSYRGAGPLSCLVRSPPAKRHWPFTWWPARSGQGAWPPSSTPSTPWIPPGPNGWALM